MSGTINKVILIGHLGDDVKMHYFDGGGCVGRFPLATNESYTNKSSGEKVTQTQWHNIVVKNKAAEIINRYPSLISNPYAILVQFTDDAPSDEVENLLSDTNSRIVHFYETIDWYLVETLAGNINTFDKFDESPLVKMVEFD